MFRIQQVPFGSYTLWKLVNSSSGEHLSLLPEYGGLLHELVLRKGDTLFSLLDAPSEKELNSGNPKFKSSKLSPYPNRIIDGKYSFAGKNYHLPVNFTTEGHAIHGLVLDAKFKVVDSKTTTDEAKVTVEYGYNGSIAGYPFPYKLTITYKLSKTNGVRFDTAIKNTGNRDRPVGDGWHPYFQTGSKIDELKLTVPSDQALVVDQRMIPTGTSVMDDRFTDGKRIGKHTLDTCFVITPKKGKAFTRIFDVSKKITLEIWQETGKHKYNFLQIYTPPTRDTIAVEPMTCAPDAFNNGMGLIALKPGESMNAAFGVNIVR